MSVPIDTPSRGRLRHWKREASARYERIEAVLASQVFQRAASDFNHKRALGRGRALAKLKTMLGEAHFEEASLDADGFALGAYLDPRQSVICPDEGVGPADLQDCVTVDFIAVGRTWDHRINKVGAGKGSGLWSLEICDHALGRALQRDPTADLDAVIHGAHRAALAMRPGPTARFLVPAGRGAFVCTLRAGPDESTRHDCVWITSHTCVHSDQLLEDQHLAARSDLPGDQLGSSLLCPLALWHLAVHA